MDILSTSTSCNTRGSLLVYPTQRGELATMGFTRRVITARWWQHGSCGGMSVTCVAILIVAIVTAATWAQLQALRRQHQWRHHRRAPYDHLLGYHIAFRPYTMLGTVQRSNRASGMLESTIRWCVCLCCSTACPTVAQPRERSSCSSRESEDAEINLRVAYTCIIIRIEPEIFL